MGEAAAAAPLNTWAGWTLLSSAPASDSRTSDSPIVNHLPERLKCRGLLSRPASYILITRHERVTVRHERRLREVRAGGYVIGCVVTGQFYVGSSSNLDKRKASH